MGTFNTLHAPAQCPACQFTYPGEYQFKFGLTWLLDYHLGDKLQWDDSKANIGKPHLARVKIYAVLANDTCPNCGVKRDKYTDEFDIHVENDVLLSITPMETYDIYMNEPDAEGDYAIL
ncbi:hypothetical protein LJ737_03145 [Hymenobacter sp. 15J16-1T3B]|uniref:hypothetical protein n=1 Tax=Hymenobacter sp. 15J16-1T3B TaxID=2886941 RepID=UPI001D10AFAB|nr:hypothetical protein [Hymenobacter sp. 15J16-1T3B]MCC3156214.1 hypothetical protein [Hymenobacter sp. 15J16-1T3B]